MVKDICVAIEKPIRMVALLVGNAVEVYLMELVVEPDILAARRTLPLQTEVYYRNYSSAINKTNFKCTILGKNPLAVITYYF